MEQSFIPQKYLQLFSFIKDKISSPHNKQALTSHELQAYRKIIAHDYFLKYIIAYYLPYSRQWEALVSQAVASQVSEKKDRQKFAITKDQEALTFNIWDIASNSPHVIALRWFVKTYANPAYFPQQKQLEDFTLDFIKKCFNFVSDGYFDNLIKDSANSDKHYFAAKTLLNLSVNNPSFSHADFTLNEILSLREPLYAYLDALQQALYATNRAGIELFILHEWLNFPLRGKKGFPLTQKDDRLLVILEALYESYCTYRAAASPVSPTQLMKNLQHALRDRMTFIMDAEKNCRPSYHENALGAVMDCLIEPFIIRDQKTHHLLPTNTLYHFYLLAREQSHQNTPSSNDASASQIVDILGDMIGFGPEHVEMLLGLLGQSVNKITQQIDTIDVFQPYEELALTSLPFAPPAMTAEEHQIWLASATKKYFESLDKPYKNSRARITFWPKNPMSCPHIIHNISLSLSTDYWLCPPSILIRLLKNNSLTIPATAHEFEIIQKLLSQRECPVDQQVISFFLHFLESLSLQTNPLSYKMNEFLHQAIRYNHRDFIKYALSCNYPTQYQASNATTYFSGYQYCLELAIKHSSYDTVHIIAQRAFAQPSANQGPLVSRYVFMSAAFLGRFDVLQDLIEQYQQMGHFPHNDFALNSLFEAAKAGHFEIAQYLIEKWLPSGDIIKKDHHNKSLLLLAAQGGSVSLVQYLLNYYAPFFPLHDQSCFAKDTALHIASSYGHIGVLRVLLQKMSDNTLLCLTNNKSQTPLNAAVAAGHTNIVRLLLKYQKAPPTSYEKNAFSFAVAFGFDHIADLFFERFAGENLLKNVLGHALFNKRGEPLFVAAVKHHLVFKEGSPNLLQKLIERDSSLEQFSSVERKNKKNCFMVAASFGNIAIFSYLIANYGCFFNDAQQDINNKTIYEYDLGLVYKKLLVQFKRKRIINKELASIDCSVLLKPPAPTLLIQRSSHQHAESQPKKRPRL